MAFTIEPVGGYEGNGALCRERIGVSGGHQRGFRQGRGRGLAFMLRTACPVEQLDIGGIEFDFMRGEHVVDTIAHWRAARERHYVVLTNPHSLMRCRRKGGGSLGGCRRCPKGRAHRQGAAAQP